MVSQGATVVAPCPSCGRPTSHDVVEFLVQHRLEWSVSVRCECGHTSVACGSDDSPELIRQALVEAHGWSRIAPVTPLPSLAAVMRVLRQGELGQMTLAEAKERAGRLLAGEQRGTRVELELLAERLRAAGVAAEVE
jgi:hypothetical protein